MARIRFHKVAAVLVLVASAVWVGTGEFSSVGSRAGEAEAITNPEAVATPKRTVAVVAPPPVKHQRAIRIAGTTAADKRAELATRVNGIVGERPVREGDRVEAGALILSLAVEDKQIAIESAKQLYAQRKTEFAAAERLVKSGTVGKLQLDTARSALAAARLQLETAQAELARNEVRAPFAGLIDKVEVEQGSSVMAGTAVATILSLDPIIGLGEVSERELGYLKVGDTADVRLVDGRMIKGTLRFISRDASATTRTFRVEIAIPNADRAIPAGMTAEIVLRAAPVDATILPRSVVTLSGDGDLGVRTVDAEGKVAFHAIDLIDDTNQGLVLAGIPADARVIVQGQDLVTEGDAVTAVEADIEALRKLAGEAL